MNIYVEDEEDMKKMLAEAVYLLYRVRRSTKVWSEVFGCEPKRIKKEWEDKADEFISKLMKKEKEIKNSEYLKIVKNP